MIPAATFELHAKRIVNERASADLQSYLRTEWGMDLHGMGRLLAEPGRPRSLRKPGRIRRWWTRRRYAPEPRAPEEAAEASRAAAPSGAGCAHPDLEPLGLAGTAAFLQCAVCGGVLVASGGRRYAIEAAGPAGIR